MMFARFAQSVPKRARVYPRHGVSRVSSHTVRTAIPHTSWTVDLKFGQMVWTVGIFTFEKRACVMGFGFERLDGV